MDHLLALPTVRRSNDLNHSMMVVRVYGCMKLLESMWTRYLTWQPCLALLWLSARPSLRPSRSLWIAIAADLQQRCANKDHICLALVSVSQPLLNRIHVPALSGDAVCLCCSVSCCPPVGYIASGGWLSRHCCKPARASLKPRPRSRYSMFVPGDVFGEVPAEVPLFLVKWLAFRLMYQAGVVKLTRFDVQAVQST